MHLATTSDGANNAGRCLRDREPLCLSLAMVRHESGLRHWHALGSVYCRPIEASPFMLETSPGSTRGDRCSDRRNIVSEDAAAV
jgi:hypothetical protein